MLNKKYKKMAKFKISGVWKDSKNIITHYAFHEVKETTTSRAEKVEKSEAVRRLKLAGNSAITWIWDYQNSFWKNGEEVEVVEGKFLRTKHNNKTIDNLSHLIDYDWLKF
ncbi:hypothetical protein ACM40_04720 [Chryseobacterium sp. BLS98]|jgi:hypothetical protein|nr:hypothetical protein ACM40_04720 [Chryseobacterium sp. BLS98]